MALSSLEDDSPVKLMAATNCAWRILEFPSVDLQGFYLLENMFLGEKFPAGNSIKLASRWVVTFVPGVAVRLPKKSKIKNHIDVG